MVFGLIDTTYIDFPAGIDAAYLRSLQTRSGMSIAQMIQDLDSALATINGTVDPLVADLSMVTPDPVGGTRGTGSKRVMKAGEYTVARPQKSSRAGHMLPIDKNELGLGFTEDGLEDMSMDAFRQELDDIVLAYDRFYLAEALTRLFSSAEVAVDDKTTIKSPGFAGSGTGDNVFAGVFPDGNPLPGGYTHYAYSSPANLATTIATFTARLEKWHRPPFDLIASPSMLGEITALAGFVDAGSALIRAAQGEAEALVDPTLYVGVLNKKIRVRNAVDGIGASKHASIFKTYGGFNPRNPLAWRYDELKGREAFTRYRASYPLVDAVTLQWLGFGVNDRAGAINIFVDTSPGSYVDPTITIV